MVGRVRVLELGGDGRVAGERVGEWQLFQMWKYRCDRMRLLLSFVLSLSKGNFQQNQWQGRGIPHEKPGLLGAFMAGARRLSSHICRNCSPFTATYEKPGLLGAFMAGARRLSSQICRNCSPFTATYEKPGLLGAFMAGARRLSSQICRNCSPFTATYRSAHSLLAGRSWPFPGLPFYACLQAG